MGTLPFLFVSFPPSLLLPPLYSPFVSPYLEPHYPILFSLLRFLLTSSSLPSRCLLTPRSVLPLPALHLLLFVLLPLPPVLRISVGVGVGVGVSFVVCGLFFVVYCLWFVVCRLWILRREGGGGLRRPNEGVAGIEGIGECGWDGLGWDGGRGKVEKGGSGKVEKGGRGGDGGLRYVTLGLGLGFILLCWVGMETVGLDWIRLRKRGLREGRRDVGASSLANRRNG